MTDKLTYGSAETGRLKVVFHIGDRQGIQEKLVAVETDDRNHPRYELRVRVHLPKVLELSPRFVHWKQDGKLEPQVLTVRVVQEQPLEVLGVDMEGEGFRAEVKDIRKGREYQVVVRPTDTAQARSVKLKLRTNPPLARTPVLYARVGLPQLSLAPEDRDVPARPQEKQ